MIAVILHTDWYCALNIAEESHHTNHSLSKKKQKKNHESLSILRRSWPWRSCCYFKPPRLSRPTIRQISNACVAISSLGVVRQAGAVHYICTSTATLRISVCEKWHMIRNVWLITQNQQLTSKNSGRTQCKTRLLFWFDDSMLWIRPLGRQYVCISAPSSAGQRSSLRLFEWSMQLHVYLLKHFYHWVLFNVVRHACWKASECKFWSWGFAFWSHGRWACYLSKIGTRLLLTIWPFFNSQQLLFNNTSMFQKPGSEIQLRYCSQTAPVGKPRRSAVSIVRH